MATYNLTPSERRARAQALKEQRENRRLYSQYLEAQKAAEIERESAWLQQKKEESEKNNQNFFTRAFSTIGDLAANVLTGAVKGLEGIYDLGAGIVGAVGGIFDKDFQGSVKQHIAYDWTSETIGNPLQEALKYSYLKDGGIIENIASGIGQMLPAVAVSVATGGLGAPAAMAQTASLLTLGASAAGNSTEEAFKDGAGYYQGLGYGLASGAVEIATEKMFGGATKALTGAGLLDGVTRSVADVGIKRIAKNALEEGVEEIVSELANPLLKSIYKGKDALSEYGSADYWKGVGQAGIVGSLTALAYSGTVGYGLSKVGVGYVGKEADIADSLSEISSLKEKGTNLQAEGRLDAKNEAKIADTVKRNYQNIESVLKKTSAEKRAKLIEKFSLDKAFNPEGTMSEQLSSWLSETPSAEQTSAEGGEKPTSELASPKKDYYSFTLRGGEQVIQEDLQKMTEDRRRAYAEQNGVTVEEAAKKVADIKVYDGEMSEQAQEHFSKMKKAINALNKMSGGNLSFVITEANDVFNGTIVDDRTVYMGVDTFESDTWAGTLVHEYTHFSEGSQEYDKLFKYLVSDDIQIDDGNGGKVKLWQKAQESVLAQNYGFTEDALQQIIKKAETGEMLTEQETRYYNAFKSEVGARMSEYLLGNEAFIDKIVAKDSSLARKFITKIHDLMSAFKRVGRDAKVEMRQLKKAESLYLAAARKAGNQALVRKILKARKERGESVEVDSATEVQYNGKESLIGKTFPTYNESQGGDANTLATRWAHRADITAGDQTLISFHDAWYLVEKFDDSDSGYQIMGEITENDYNRIAEDIKRNGASGRIQSIQRAFTDYAQFDKRRDSARREESSPRGVQTEHGGEDTKVLQVDRDESQRGQTQSDGSGDSKGRRKSKRGVKYSLKEGEVSESALAEIEREETVAYDAERDTKKKLDAIEGFDEAKEKLYSVLNDKTSTNADIDAALNEYAKWEKESGYGDAYKAYQEASRRTNELRRDSESMRDKLSKKLLERKYTSEEVSGFVQKAVRKFHTTPYLNRASYLLTTGSMLDFSDGQGYRVQDHREISEILNLPDYANYSDGMIVFMNMGNIRLQSYGIDIAAMPTDKQISSLRGIISKVMAEYDEFVVDFSKPNGNTNGSITYPEGTSSARIIADIKKYFESGVLPEEPSTLSKFRYSLKTVPPVQPSSDAWTPTIDTDRALVRFPNLWNVKAEESEVRNPTQIKGTVSTYRKIFDALKKEGFDGRILDASSGLGYGTQAGITEYGFDVDDIEPYPDSKYKPKYTDYSSLDERYDVIISNAVLNVLPQDQRDALVVKMGELLNRGGRLFINVRGDDVNNLASNPNNVKIGDMEWYVAPTGSYQKGFTRAELVAYLKDALGENFTVEPTTQFGKSSAIVTKISDNVRYSLKDSEGKTLSEGQQKYFADSKVRDSEGNLLVVYHGTMSGDFTVFDASYSNVESDMGAGFYFSSSYEDVNSNYEEGGQDLEAKIERLAEKIEAEEEIDYDEAKEKAKNRLSKKSKLFEVYLDIKNPAYVGGNIDSQTTLFRDLYDDIELNMEDFDSEDDYYEALYSEQDDAIREFADKVNDMLESKGISGYEEWFEILANDGAFEGASISQVKEALNGSLYDCYDANGDYAVNEVVRTIIEALGYDGIIDNSVVDKWGYNSGRTHYMQGLDEETRHYIVFKPEQIKLTSNTNPTTNEDIRWSLKNDPMERRYSAELSDGQVKKLLANNTKLKVYTKAEAESIVNNIISNYLDFGEKYGVISGKTRKQAVEILWRGLNTADPGRQMKVALDIAEYIIQNSVMESVYDDAESETHIYTISLLKPYLHSIDLSRIKGEIKYRYGNDNSVYLLWGKRKGTKGYGADQIAQILEEQGMRIDAINDADIFFEIDSAYRAAVAALKSKAKTLLSSAMSSTERKALKQQIAREVLLGFDEKGKASKLSKIIDIYREKANVWKKAYYEERSKNKLLNRILDKVQKLKDIKLGTFLNASQFKSDIFKGSIEKLANIKYRGNLNEAGTRKIITNLSEWYVKENPMLEGVYEDEVADMLRSISEGEGKLDADELKTLEKVVDYFKHFIETYNKVYRNGEFVDAQPIAENYVRIIQENKGVKVGWFAKLTAMRYFKTFADPMTVARRMDMYEGGFYTEMLERLREGAVGASIMEMEMREPLEEFYKKNKKFLKELAKNTVKYQGQDIPLSQAMLLYMTLNREQALKGLAESGFTYTVDKETVRLKGFAVGEELTLEELKQRAKAVQDELSKQFSELDKEYISIAEKLFNETCKQAKRETDIKRKGYSNALEDYYVPIRRAFIAHNVDTSTFADEMNRVSNASFNRDTVKGAKNELYIDALDAVLDRHIRAVAQYANLSLAIDEYNKLFNLDLGDNPNKPKSVRTESVDVWREGDEYFKKLISDIQGIPVVKGEGAKFMSFIRGGYAKFQLGANPKVWVTQLSSFAAAGSILDLDSITRGLSIKTNDVDEYCKLAKLRNNDNTVALAQGVLDKVGTVGNALMIPIGKVDRFVVKRLFGACQVQVEKDSGLKIGTEENKVKAGELLKKVILETQQNAMATERSAAMRSGNELMKTLTMFTADSMKVIGRVIDSVGELSVLKSKLKATTDAKQIADLNEKIKKANKKTRKAIASLVTSAVFMALVAQLFRTLYNRDDDDDNIIVNMTVDAVGNLFGGLPIIKDIYARFTEGYDLDNYAYSAINNLFDSAEGIFNMVGNVISGDWDSKELARNAKNLLFTAGQILGLPTRNVYNIGYGLIKRFSPSTAYKIDDMFYNQKYRSDLNKAIERDDDEMIATIVGIMLDENIGDITSSTARKELDRLVKAGYSVIPRGVGNSVTYEGEEYALTARQAKDFKAVYSTANEALASLVTLSQYSSASDDVKAKAVNFVFDTYYNLALQDFLGVEIESKNVLFAEAIDIEKLAIIVAMARALTADLDKKGNAISGTRKAKVQSYINSLKLTAAQKYMIMGYLGYTNTKGEAQVKAYINRLKLTKSEKAKLLKYSGYSK